jgi:RimJ/RimL family protein N-acetyltransferase
MVVFGKFPLRLCRTRMNYQNSLMTRKRLLLEAKSLRSQRWIFDYLGSRVVGSTRFRCIEVPHRRVEIGFTFLAASWQRTYVNTEAKYLMLGHAFEMWGCNRVELLTDERNSESRNAILRLGGKQEGTVRCHMVMRDGFVRNSVLYSIIATEWPQVKVALEAKLNAA